jgi:hypothetical protein
MADLSVLASPRAPESIIGGSLVVETTIQSAAPPRTLVEVHAPETDPGFEYELTSPNRGTFLASSQRFAQARDIHPVPPPEPQPYALRPGDQITFVEDIGAWLVPPAPPGDYTLVVRYRTLAGELVESEPSSVRVVAPQPARVVSSVGLSGVNLTTVFTHVMSPAETAVMVRVAEPGKPEVGLSHEWHRAKAGEVSGLAAATEMEGPSAWRWIGWLEGDAFRAALVWGGERMKLVDPIAHDLANASLLPAAWQSEAGEARFAIVGERAGTTHLVVVDLPRTGAPVTRAFDLGGRAVATAIGAWRASPRVLDLVRADASARGFAIGAQRVELDGPPRAFAPRWSAPLDGALLALTLPPLLADAPLVDALVALAPLDPSTPARLGYYRAPLLGGIAPVTHMLELPPPLVDSSAPGADGWSIAQVPHRSAPILAHVGSELWTADAASPSRAWRRLVESRHGIVLPHLVHETIPDGTTDGRVFAAWFEEVRGFSVAELYSTEH